MYSSNCKRYAPWGFTLIEVMIVVLVIGIIATIAYPSYIDQVRKSRRTEAKTLLLEAQSRQEQFFTENNSYAASMTGLGYDNNNEPTENDWYTVDSTKSPGGCAPNTVTPCSGFTLTATAKKDQTNDDRCGDLSIIQTGKKAVTGSASVKNCW